MTRPRSASQDNRADIGLTVLFTRWEKNGASHNRSTGIFGAVDAKRASENDIGRLSTAIRSARRR